MREETWRRVIDFSNAIRARGKSMSPRFVEPLRGARPGGLGTLRLDLFRPLRELRQYGDALGKDFGEAVGNRQVCLLLPLPVPQLADRQLGEQRRVPGKDTEIAVDSGDLDLLDLLFDDGTVGSDDLQF